MDMMSLRRRVLVNQNKLVSASGNPLTFNTPLTKPLKECVVRFTPKQSGSGTPSPENVREIVGKNGITVWQSGKNLYPATASSSTYQAVNLKMGVNYTFSAFTEGTPYFRLKFEDDTISGIVWMRNETSDGRKYLTLAPSKNVVGAFIYLGVGLTEPMIEVGSEPTAYEPYIPPVETSVSFPSITKNILDETKWSKSESYEFQGAYGYIFSDVFYLEPNATYTVTVHATDETIGNCLWCIKNYAGTDVGVNTSSTFLYPRNGAYWRNYTFTTGTLGAIRFGINKQSYSTIQDALDAIFNAAHIQLEKGSTATAYEPFDNTIYGGYVDLVAGEVVAEKDALVFDGGEVWNLYRANENTCVYAYRPGRKPLDQNEICSHFIVYSGAGNTLGHPNTYVWGSSTGNVFIQVPATLASDVTAFKQFLADEAQKGTPVTIVANPLEPIHYPLSPRILTTLKGQNVMWSDANGDITVRYWTR